MPGSETPPTPAGEVMPLVGYTPGWVLLGAALLVLVLAYYLFVLAFTRRRLPAPVPAPPAPAVDLGSLRIEAHSRVDEVVRAARAGELEGRGAHERLSAVVRDYVAAATGIPADRMTLADLERSPLQGTTRAVARFYPAVFAADPHADLDRSVRAAREVLDGWR